MTIATQKYLLNTFYLSGIVTECLIYITLFNLLSYSQHPYKISSICYFHIIEEEVKALRE